MVVKVNMGDAPTLIFQKRRGPKLSDISSTTLLLGKHGVWKKAKFNFSASSFTVTEIR